MKRKFINGLLLAAALVAASNVFVSCKDNDADVNTELQSKMNGLSATIQSLQNELITVKNSIPAGYNDAALQSRVNALQTELNALSSKVNGISAYDDTAMKEALASTAAELALIETRLLSLNSSIAGIVTDVIVEGTTNSAFTGVTLPGLNPLVLGGYYNKVTKDFVIPTAHNIKGVAKQGADAGDELASATAGRIYLTLNPTGATYANKTVQLVTSAGNVSPMTIGALEPCDEELEFGLKTRADNGFYCADVAFNAEIAKNCALKINMKDLVSDFSKVKNFTSAISKILSNFTGVAPRYAANVSWSDVNLTNTSVNSGYQILAASFTPQSFEFSVKGFGVPYIESIEKKVRQDGNASIANYIENFKKNYEAVLDSVHYLVQPVLIVKDADGFHRALNTVKAGEVELHPTTWTQGMIAPIYKKFVVVTKVDGKVAATGDNPGKLGEVLDGADDTVPMTVEKGKTYEVYYEAVDFFGNIVKQTYTFTGI